MITTELSYLTWTTIITALMWMPYVLNLIAVRGLVAAVSYPVDPKPLAPWAARMKQAHANAIENLVVFATLVLVAHISGVNNEVTAIACAVYFWARVVHFVVLGFGIPWIRTLSFVTGFGCQLALAWQILM
ncbi:MAPEG family protein [Gammaproteobacteria bacterium]|nr:MAPEG family protein [Gammaproteobacteria bacterium]